MTPTAMRLLGSPVRFDPEASTRKFYEQEHLVFGLACEWDGSHYSALSYDLIAFAPTVPLSRVRSIAFSRSSLRQMFLGVPPYQKISVDGGTGLISVVGETQDLVFVKGRTVARVDALTHEPGVALSLARILSDLNLDTPAIQAASRPSQSVRT